MISLEFTASNIGQAMDYVRQATTAPLSVSQSGRLGYEVTTGDSVAIREVCDWLAEQGIAHNVDGEEHHVR